MKQQDKLNRKEPKLARFKGEGKLRTIVLEILFFIAFAVFGFSLVSYFLGGRVTEVFSFAPGVSSGEAGMEEEESFGLYEMPSQRELPEPTLSPIFAPSVQYWRDDILLWAAEYGVDPNLIATVMQIESCGNPQAGSGAGALGLFQVMPYHFEDGEIPFDPDTNAKRGMGYLTRGLEISEGHAGLALAGYNGGHSVISREYALWANETQRYYRWGSGIYREASAGWDSSPTLSDWMAAGGSSLCDDAEEYLDIESSVVSQ